MESDFEVLVKTRTILNQVTDALEECAMNLAQTVELAVPEDWTGAEQEEVYAHNKVKKYLDLVERARNV